MWALNRHAWQGGAHLAAARIALGLYLAVHYVSLLPYAAETFGGGGVLPRASQNPWQGAASTPLGVFDAPWMVNALVAALTVVAVAYAAGFRTRVAGLLLWMGAWLLWVRNQLTLNPSLPFLGFWFVAQCFLPPDPPLSLDRWLSRVPRRWNRIPNDLATVIWTVTGAAYSYSGWTKWKSPSWANGRAIEFLLTSPLARDGALVDGALSASRGLCAAATFAILALELAYLPLALVPRARPWLWLATMAMHVGIAMTMRMADISLAMLAFHGLLFDPSWWRGRAPRVGVSAPCGAPLV